MIETEGEKAIDYEHSGGEHTPEILKERNQGSLVKASKESNLFSKQRKQEPPSPLKMGSGLIGQRMSSSLLKQSFDSGKSLNVFSKERPRDSVPRT